MKKPSQGAAKKRIKFKNPPINELSIGLFHLPIVEMKAQHVGIYWHHIRERYPLCEQHTPVVSLSDHQQQPVFQDVQGEVFPLPRFWFSSQSHPTLIQVQRNAFMLNWRRGTSEEYPHYEKVVENFWHELEGYKTFLQNSVGAKLDVLQRCELTYVNLVTPIEAVEHPAQLLKVVPSIASLRDIQSRTRELTALNATVTYQISPTLLIDLAMRSGRRVDTKDLMLLLELKAYGVPSDLSLDGARAWFDAAHDAVYELFLEATDKDVQKAIWKPR